MQKGDKDSGEKSVMAERLRFLLKDRSQADLARKTGESVSNVCRYLAGRRIPAEFCTAIVRGLGVNPAWLLTGEGAPYLTDVTADVKQTAGDMLELVKAMASVERMKLGALMGSEHGRVLKELDDGLREYETLRSRMEERVKPTLKLLLDDLSNALNRREYDRGRDLIKAIEQVMRLNSDEALRLRFQELHAYLLHSTGGDVERVVKLQFESMWHTMMHTRSWGQALSARVYNHAISLLSLFRVREARAFCRAVRELAAAREASADDMYALDVAQAQCDIVLGNVRAALPVLSNYRRWKATSFSNLASLYHLASFYAGAISVREYVALACGSWFASDPTASLALWTETPADLSLALGETTSDALVKKKKQPLVCATLLLEAIEGRAQAALTRFDEVFPPDASPEPRSWHIQALLRTQRARLHWRAGNIETAAAQVRETQAFLDGFPADIDLQVLYPAAHWRNVIEILPPSDADSSLRARAYAFFDRMFEQGCAIFEPWTSYAAPTAISAL